WDRRFLWPSSGVQNKEDWRRGVSFVAPIVDPSGLPISEGLGKQSKNALFHFDSYGQLVSIAPAFDALDDSGSGFGIPASGQVGVLFNEQNPFIKLIVTDSTGQPIDLFGNPILDEDTDSE